MPRVYLVRSPRVGKFSATWSLYRFGEGPGRCEGHLFKTKDEARAFAKAQGHKIIKKRNQ